MGEKRAYKPRKPGGGRKKLKPDYDAGKNLKEQMEMKRWRADQTEENFWGVVVAYAGAKFKTYSGLPFSYEIKKGRNGEYTKELWIDRREKSKSLAWSSIVLALGNIKGEVVERPKALGDIRGVTYIYGIYRIRNPKGGIDGQYKWNDLQKDGDCNGESFFGYQNSGFVCEWDDGKKEETTKDNSAIHKKVQNLLINSNYSSYPLLEYDDILEAWVYVNTTENIC